MDVLSAARSILQIEQKEDTQNTYTLRQIKNNLAPEGEDIPFLILSSGKIEWLCINNEPEKEQLIRSSDSDAHSEIDELPISTRVVNVLKRAGKDTIETSTSRTNSGQPQAQLLEAALDDLLRKGLPPVGGKDAWSPYPFTTNWR